MTDTQNITDIKTGEGFDGLRAAVIAAPSDAKAGSLECLTRFFHEHGYDAQLGYAGENKQHVLRIHGLPNDSTLRNLLLKDYPAWEDGQQIEHRASSTHISFPDDIAFEPMENSPAEQKRSFTQAIRENSTSAAALSYTAGNIGLVFSALYGSGQGEKKELLKLGAPVCYTMASAFLFFLNRQRPDPRSMEQIWDSIAPALLDDNHKPTAAEQEALRDEGGKVVGHVWEFMQKHPWETSGLLNMIGAGTHVTSSLLRGQKTEAMAALSTLTAMAITTFVPEKSKHAPVARGAFASPDEKATLEAMKTVEKHHGVFQPFFDAGQKLCEWVQEKPLRAASLIQLGANTGYGAAALAKKDADGNRATDWGLLASSGTFITGNGFQAIASKGNGPSFDDAVTKAADAIAYNTEWKNLSAKALRPRIMRVAKALAKQPEISHSEGQLATGILERLNREQDTASATAPMEGFIPTEKALLKDSPFISPHMVESVLDSTPQGQQIS